MTLKWDDEATFTAELRDQRIKYENEYRDYIAQQKKEEVNDFIKRLNVIWLIF